MVKTTHSGKPPMLAAIAFIALAIVSHRETPLPGDVRFEVWVQRWNSDFALNIARFGNWLGLAVPIGLVALAAALAFAFKKCWLETGFMAVAYAAKALNPALKAIVDAPRPIPDLARVSEHASGSGFPSGHVMGVSLVLGAAALMIHRRFPSLRRPAWTVATLGILVTAFGRMSVGAHWPSQTLGGLLAAITLVGLLDRLRGMPARLRSSPV